MMIRALAPRIAGLVISVLADRLQNMSGRLKKRHRPCQTARVFWPDLPRGVSMLVPPH